MSSGRVRVLAWGLAVVGLVTLIPATAWSLAHSASRLSWTATASQAAALTTVGAVGLVLTLRRPENSVGWILASVWAYTGCYTLLTAYAESLALQGPDVAGDAVATWVMNWAWVPAIGVIAFYPLLLFPTGRPPGPRWRPLVPGTAVLLAAWTMSFAFQSSQYSDAYGHQIPTGNPYASPWLPRVVDALPSVFALVFIALVVTAIVGLVRRYRRGDAVTQAQLKWFLLGALCWLPVLLYPGDHGTGGVIDVLVAVAIAGPPIAMGVAILRYRLYDIDRILSRTASYTIVTAAVVGTYAVVVATVSRLVPKSSTLAIAGATLAAAALARPLLTRVQARVDRRFNRARYEADKTVDAFGARLREAVEPTLIADDLTGVVSQTLQPAGISLWMRGEA